MESDFTAIALVLAGLATACAFTFGAMLARFRRTTAARQRELERQVQALRQTVQILETPVPDEYAPVESQEVTEVGRTRPADAASADPSSELAPEIQAVIAAAAVAYEGRHARVRSLRLVESPHPSAWSQQGRMLVQSSHNVRAKA